MEQTKQYSGTESAGVGLSEDSGPVRVVMEGLRENVTLEQRLKKVRSEYYGDPGERVCSSQRGQVQRS